MRINSPHSIIFGSAMTAIFLALFASFIIGAENYPEKILFKLYGIPDSLLLFGCLLIWVAGLITSAAAENQAPSLSFHVANVAGLAVITLGLTFPFYEACKSCGHIDGIVATIEQENPNHDLLAKIENAKTQLDFAELSRIAKTNISHATDEQILEAKMLMTFLKTDSDIKEQISRTLASGYVGRGELDIWRREIVKGNHFVELDGNQTTAVMVMLSNWKIN